MQFPKLTPLQSRFAASCAASLVLVILYFTLSNPHFAYAADVDSIIHEDHNHPRSPHSNEARHQYPNSELELEIEERATRYESDFVGVDRSVIGRAPLNDPGNLEDNIPVNNSIVGGDLPQIWTYKFPSSPGRRAAEEEISSEDQGNDTDYNELRRRLIPRQAVDSLWITINICDQPSPNVSTPAAPLPPLTLAYSEQGSSSSSNIPIDIVDGFGGNLNPIQASGTLVFSVQASASQYYNGSYAYQLTASSEAPYGTYQDNSSYFNFVDSDTNSALIMTGNISDGAALNLLPANWNTNTPPYSIFVYNQNDTAIQGMQRSICALKKHAQVAGGLRSQNTTAAKPVDISTRSISDYPVQQFYIQGLNGSSSYSAVLALDGNASLPTVGSGTLGGSGTVWPAVDFTTKSDGNCQILYNLSFCSDIAYAVPSNPDMTDLGAFYDNSSQSLYTNFDKSLQQIPCNTTASAQYSLAVTCDDCARAYKKWLCAVIIPRCEDFSNPAPYLQPRNINQTFINGTNPSVELGGNIFDVANQKFVAFSQSRNATLDEVVKPGPYKEILPCIDLCYGLVRSCPASLQFACPLPGKGQNMSYGNVASDPANVTCSDPGAYWPSPNAASVPVVSWGQMGIALTIAVFLSVWV